MTLAQEDLNAIRDEIDEALEDKLDDALSDVGELAHQVEWMRRDADRWLENLKRHTGLVRSLVVKFAELRETLERVEKKVND